MKCFFLSMALFISLLSSGMAQVPRPPAYLITSDTVSFEALPDSCWQTLADPTGKITLQEALNSDHFQDADRTINYKVHVYWLRFRIVNGMQAVANIAFPENAARADLYTQLNGGVWNHVTTGSVVRWSGRAGLKRIPAFMLTIPAGGTLTVYKRVYWNYVAAQPDSMFVYYTSTKKLIQQDYIQDESSFMTSIQDAFLMGMYVLSFIISLYFFIVVRKKEFLYFSLFFLVELLVALTSLNDVFLRQYPAFLLYLYIFCNSIVTFFLIHSLRHFLKTFSRFPGWDKFLIIFSIVEVIWLLATGLTSSVLRMNLAEPSHVAYNLMMLISGMVILITLFLFVRVHRLSFRLMLIALTPVICLQILVYATALALHLYYPRFGAPTVHGYVLSFNRAAFFIMILCYLWMVIFFNWVLILQFYQIRKDLAEQSILGQLKSRFFANISHEFRTPLTMIIGPLEDSMHGEDPAGLMRTVPAMYRNSKRLLQLINQLLDLSKLDSSDYRVNTTREDIIPFITQIVSSFSSMAEKKNIHLELKVDPDLSIALEIENTFFYFDEDIMEKIVSNLLSNALKFTEKGGEVIVSLGLADDKKEFLELKVADNGTGIPSGKLSYIFERFYQADLSSKRQYEGSGIGLSLVKELVELHGGKITATSRLARGTIFTCLLPLNKKLLADKAAPAKTKTIFPAMPVTEAEEEYAWDNHPPGQSNEDQPQVLIVEDNEDVRKYIAEKLQDQYAIIEAGNGKEGFEKALEAIPDLVISDVMMPVRPGHPRLNDPVGQAGGPEMDGFELCKRLKTDDRTSHIPVILLTARAEDSDKMSGLEAGADAYLIKPFNSKELNIRVHNLIALRNKLRAKFSDKLTVRPSEITVTPRDQIFMQKLLTLVEDHLEEAQYSVEHLGGEMNMSSSQLYRKLKAIINQSPQQFIRSIRMQRALEHLRSSDISVGEVSWKVGFENPGYFSRVFKNYFGCLPTEKEKFPEKV